jgi:SAM-dependent methyltransferase
MELSTARRLAALNQRFYAEHAENFADARPRLPAGVQRVLADITPGQRVLEVGCGDGKVGRALARTGVAAYLGVDLSQAMLDRARRYTEAEERKAVIDFQPADLADPDWTDVLPQDPFDWAVAFAVFHHLPGKALRGRALRDVAAHVRAGGRVVISNWQFSRSPRLMSRVADWAQAGLSTEDVDAGDYLLTWERAGRSGLRYVHLLDEAEARESAADAGLRVVDVFRSDGVSGDLSDYVVIEKAKGGLSNQLGPI